MARTTLTETSLPIPNAVAWASLALTAADASSLSTTLSGSMSASTTAAAVASVTGFTTGDYILVDAEVMKITAIASGFTVTRAQMGTQATAHASSAAVTNLMFGNRVVPSTDNDVILALNTDPTNPHVITLRGPNGIATISIPPSSTAGLGFVMTPTIPRVGWASAVDSGAFWFNVDSALVLVAVITVP